MRHPVGIGECGWKFQRELIETLVTSADVACCPALDASRHPQRSRSLKALLPVVESAKDLLQGSRRHLLLTVCVHCFPGYSTLG